MKKIELILHKNFVFSQDLPTFVLDASTMKTPTKRPTESSQRQEIKREIKEEIKTPVKTTEHQELNHMSNGSRLVVLRFRGLVKS